MKKYMDLTNGQKLQIEVWYDKGGMNYFSATVNRRGYYLSVTPVEISDRMVIRTLFKGLKMFLLEVKRQSPKSEREAEQIAATKEKELINAVLLKENLELVGIGKQLV